MAGFFEAPIAFFRGIINAKTVASTVIGTAELPGGSSDLTMQGGPFLVLVTVTKGNTLTTVPIFSVGTNAPNYDNVLGSTTLPAGVASAQDQAVFLAKQDSVGFIHGAGMRVNITTAATVVSGDFELRFVVLYLIDSVV